MKHKSGLQYAAFRVDLYGNLLDKDGQCFQLRLGQELLAWQETAHAGPQGSSEGSYTDDIGAKCLVLVFDHVKNHSKSLYCAEMQGTLSKIDPI